MIQELHSPETPVRSPRPTPDYQDPPIYEPTPLVWRFFIFAAVVFLVCLTYSLGASIGPRSQALYGAVAIFGAVAMFSTNLNAVNWRTIFWGIVLQVVVAAFVTFPLYLPDWTGVPYGYQPGHALFSTVGTMFHGFADYAGQAGEFVFGSLATRQNPIFVITVVPTIVFVSSFFALVHYLGILPFLVRHISRFMSYCMGTSGAETLSSVANVFMGQAEAPLIVKPYIARMTQSELLALMVGGMATISGALMVAYVTQFKANAVDLLTTSLMAAPASLYLAKLMYPETENPETLGVIKTVPDKVHRNALDALTAGASDGMALAINVIAMLIAFIAVIAMVDALLKMIPFRADGLREWLGDAPHNWDLAKRYCITFFVYFLAVLSIRYPFRWGMRRLGQDHYLEAWKRAPWQIWIVPIVLGYLLFMGLTDLAMRQADGEISLQVIFSKLFHPLAMMMGVSREDAAEAANLLGLKLVGNEFLAFQEMAKNTTLSDRSRLLMNFALTGFANFASVGITIGGISAMAPQRRPELARLGIRALYVGFLTTILNAAIVGIFRAV